MKKAASLALALEWASRGFPVFPLAISWDDVKKKTNKVPKVERGHLAASTDPAELRRLWAEAWSVRPGEEWGVGMRPGPAGYVVLDPDVPDGPAAADAAGADHTWTADTPSGGEHRYFRKVNQVRKYGNETLPEWKGTVDVRADNGYVVAPGTETSWGAWALRQEWDDTAVRLLPESLGLPWTDAEGRSGGVTAAKAPAGAQGAATASASGPSWRCYDPDEHDARLHPLTVETHHLLVEEYGIDPDLTAYQSKGEQAWLQVTRPGKGGGVSGTVGFVGPDVLWVFSSSWDGLDADRAYHLSTLEAMARGRKQSGHVSESAESADSGHSGPDQGQQAGAGGVSSCGAPSTSPSQSADTGDSGRFQLRPASTFARTRVTFLRPGVPQGMVTVVVGEEGTGKGLWEALSIKALTDAGRNVILVAPEDDEDRMLGPRLEAAGVDTSRVYVIDPAAGGRSLSLPHNAAELSVLIAQVDAVAVFVDPWISVVDGTLQVKDPQQARKVLDPMVALAKQTGAAFIAVVHPNRGDGSMRDRVSLTSVLRHAARSLLWVIADPDDRRSVYVGQEKSNLQPPGQPSQHFRINTADVAMDDGDPCPVPYLSLTGDDQRDIRQIDADFRNRGPEGRNSPEEWLRLRLGADRVPGDTVEAEAEALGISGYALANAAKSLSVVKRPGGFQKPWTWELPEAQKPRSAPESQESPESAESGGRPLWGASESATTGTANRVSDASPPSCPHCGFPVNVAGRLTHEICEQRAAEQQDTATAGPPGETTPPEE